MIRDAPSYGIYFWVYEGMKRLLEVDQTQNASGSNAWKLLLAGGMAGAVSWTSIYPLDVVKSRLQMQVVDERTSSVITTCPARSSEIVSKAHPSITLCTERQYHHDVPSTAASRSANHNETALLNARVGNPPHYASIKDCIVRSYRADGPGVFFRGLGPTIIRGFPVNAVTFWVYEVVLDLLGG